MNNSAIAALIAEFNRTKGDHPQYASGLSAAIAIVRELEEEKPGTITTGDLKVSGGPSEVSVVDDESLKELLCDAFYAFPGYWAGTKDMALSGPQLHGQMSRLLDAIRPYLRTTKPVSILACASALGGEYMAFHRQPEDITNGELWKKMAKAVLDAAGVTHVD